MVVGASLCVTWFCAQKVCVWVMSLCKKRLRPESMFVGDVFVHLSSMFCEVSIAVIGLLVHNSFQQYLSKQHEKESKKDY